MATDFFQRQDSARRRTLLGVVLFVAAVIAIIVVVYAVFALAYSVVVQDGGFGPKSPQLLLTVGSATIAIIGLGSLFKMAQLRGGGPAIAEQLGGRLLDPGAATAQERQVLNVVEEMAIASGVPVPPVYLLENENAINAFAAGFSPSDAVIGVSRGAVEKLSREQLQGVVAHEFSHILNGDMRLNLRLIGLLHGILVIGLIGQMAIRSLRYVRSRDKDEVHWLLLVAAVGVALFLIGYLGFFFGKLIKAAVSRQREYLADASAVQFTRNPEGIGGALITIGGYVFGSRMRGAHAEQISHMFFGQGVGSAFGVMLATHPPLPKRIRAVLPNWDGKFPRIEPSEQAQRRIDAKLAHLAPKSPAAGGVTAVLATQPAVEMIGMTSAPHLVVAARIRQQIDDSVLKVVHEPTGAIAIVLAMLLDRDSGPNGVQRQQLASVRGRFGEDMQRMIRRVEARVWAEEATSFLPLIDMALPPLRDMSPGQFVCFRSCLNELIHADRQVTLFEWMLRCVVMRHLSRVFVDPQPRPVKYDRLEPVAQSCGLLLSTLALVGHDEGEQAAKAFRAGVSHLGIEAPLFGRTEARQRSLDAALDELEQLVLRDRKKVLVACAACISADHSVTHGEAELLRAVSDALGLPMPPMLPGQRLV